MILLVHIWYWEESVHRQRALRMKEGLLKGFKKDNNTICWLLVSERERGNLGFAI